MTAYARLLLPAAALALSGAALGQVSINNTTAGAWIDISATGTPLNLTDDGAVTINTTVGNVLLPAGDVRVGSNGAVRFTGTGQSLGFTNGPIPSTAAFSGQQTLMVFWDDINTVNGSAGQIYWQELGNALVISWVDAGFYSSADTASFQMQIFGSGTHAAQFVYQDVSSARADNGGSATIGYQAGGVDNDVQWSFNATVLNDGDVLTITGGGASGQIGTNYCQPSNANSTGVGATMLATGSDVAGGNPLSLRMLDLPPNQFGYFLCSRTQGFIPLVGGGQGNLCIAIPFGRFASQLASSGAGGFIEISVDTLNMPLSPIVPILPGETWHFQGWFRDVNPNNTSNLTDGLRILFQ